MERRITIDEVLGSFFREQRVGKSGLRLERIIVVEQQLRAFLETEGARRLSADDLVIVEAEREFDPHEPFIRTMHAGDLLRNLGGFIEPAALPDDLVQCGVQITSVDKLLTSLGEQRLFSGLENMDAFAGVITALSRARRDVQIRKVRLRASARLGDRNR